MNQPTNPSMDAILNAIKKCSNEDHLVLVIMLIVVVNKIPLDLERFLQRLREQLGGLDYVK